MKKQIKGKLQLNLVPTEGIKAVARVREYGCKKYEDTGHEYLLDDLKISDLIGGMDRHVLALKEGKLIDDGKNGSQELHLANIATSAMMCIQMIHRDCILNDMDLNSYAELYKDNIEIEQGLIYPSGELFVKVEKK